MKCDKKYRFRGEGRSKSIILNENDIIFASQQTTNNQFQTQKQHYYDSN